jgi:hypothetical protein
MASVACECRKSPWKRLVRRSGGRLNMIFQGVEKVGASTGRARAGWVLGAASMTTTIRRAGAIPAPLTTFKCGAEQASSMAMEGPQGHIEDCWLQPAYHHAKSTRRAALVFIGGHHALTTSPGCQVAPNTNNNRAVQQPAGAILNLNQ